MLSLSICHKVILILINNLINGCLLGNTTVDKQIKLYTCSILYRCGEETLVYNH